MQSKNKKKTKKREKNDDDNDDENGLTHQNIKGRFREQKKTRREDKGAREKVAPKSRVFFSNSNVFFLRFIRKLNFVQTKGVQLKFTEYLPKLLREPKNK